jgi:hypothetical protein
VKQSANKGVIDRAGALVFEDTGGNYIDFAFIGEGIFAAKRTEDSLQYLDRTGVPLTEAVYTAGRWNYRVLQDPGRFFREENLAPDYRIP